MPSRPEQATLNLEQARDLRTSGCSYRQIRQQLGLTISQLSLIRRTLKREKAAQTRLHRVKPDATARDLLVAQSILPPELRRRLTASGFRTLADLEDRLADPDLPGLETLPGVGTHRVQLVKRMLQYFDLLPGPSDLKASVEALFPELGDNAGASSVPAPQRANPFATRR